MARAPPVINPHEMRFERGERALEAAAERVNTRARGDNHRRPLTRILEPGPGPQREALDAAYLFGTVRRVERGIDFGEIPHVRPMQNRRTQLDRLDRILPA